MVRTHEEIKKGLECCSNATVESCGECSYHTKEDHSAVCIVHLTKDAKALLAQVERERDAAVSELASNCRACRFIVDDSHCEDCFQRVGKHPWSPIVRTKFEWRGICAENTKEDEK